MSDFIFEQDGDFVITLPSQVPSDFKIAFSCGGQRIRVELPKNEVIPIPPKTTIDPEESISE